MEHYLQRLLDMDLNEGQSFVLYFYHSQANAVLNCLQNQPKLKVLVMSNF